MATSLVTKPLDFHTNIKIFSYHFEYSFIKTQLQSTEQLFKYELRLKQIASDF